MKRKDIVIFDFNIAKDLMNRGGFQIKNIQRNTQNEDMTVFYFDNTEEVKGYLERIWGIRVPV